MRSAACGVPSIWPLGTGYWPLATGRWLLGTDPADCLLQTAYGLQCNLGYVAEEGFLFLADNTHLDNQHVSGGGGFNPHFDLVGELL
jgi:hypothetical protein